MLRPERVFSTPISEASIVGIANGLALNGFKPFAEIMFGDFMTLAFDQIVNHASKFYHMYNKKIKCPVVIRTPMGARRGYGPTHSQTLDKFLVGIDNVKTVAPNVFINPAIIYQSVFEEEHPTIIIENKIDYGKKILAHTLNHFIYESTSDRYPVVRIRPALSDPTITIVAYGGMAEIVASILEEVFIETDLKPELYIPSLISELPIETIVKATEQSGRLLVIEEGTGFAGIGSELISSITENSKAAIRAKRIAALPVPIPAVKSLENAVLPEKGRILKEIKEFFS
jgi:2-oxoisovalerate dehydrogenase E1 component